MGKNIILIVGILVVALIAIMGTASAYSVKCGNVTFTLDSITRNGHYMGTPVLLSGEVARYGYNYTLVPDGTYTVNGHATNDARVPKNASIDFLSYSSHDYKIIHFTVPAAGKSQGRADFSITINSLDTDFDSVGVNTDEHIGEFLFHVGKADDKIVDAEDLTQHTIDEGPMSDGVAVYNDGKMVYTGLPQYSIGLY